MTPFATEVVNSILKKMKQVDFISYEEYQKELNRQFRWEQIARPKTKVYGSVSEQVETQPRKKPVIKVEEKRKEFDQSKLNFKDTTELPDLNEDYADPEIEDI